MIYYFIVTLSTRLVNISILDRHATALDRAASDPTHTDELFRATTSDYPDVEAQATNLYDTRITSLGNPSNLPPIEHSTAAIDTAQARMAAVRRRVAKWNIAWGPIRQWPHCFEDAYAEALDQGCTDAWANEVQLVVDEGRNLVRDLGDVIDGTLPSEVCYVRDLWRSAMDMMCQLCEGISALETRLQIVAPYPEDTLLHLAARRIR